MNTQKKWWKTVLKVVLWFVGIWAVLLVTLQLTLSEKVLTKLVNRYAAEYIDGDLSFGSASVSMFKRFPRVFLTLEDFAVTYPADRFDTHEKAGAQGHLMYMGCGETADTLASFDSFSASINVVSLIGGTIRIPHLSLVQPRIFAHTYANGDANWNIFKVSPEEEEEAEEDTGFVIPDLSLGRISIRKHPHIVYTDSRDTVFAMIDITRIGFNGEVNSKRPKGPWNRIGLRVDSMFVAGRLKSDTLALAVEKFHIQEDDGHMDIEGKARAMLATSAFGRIPVPVEMSGRLEKLADTVTAVALKEFKARVADIPLVADAELRFNEGRTRIKAKAGIKDCRINDVLHGFAKSIIPELDMLDVDGSITALAQCNGDYVNATGRLPEVKGNASIQAATKGISLDFKGEARDLLGADPSVKVDGNLLAVLDSIATVLPDTLGISAGGSILAKINGEALLSQLNMYNFSRSSLTGNITSDKLVFTYPKDTVDVDIEGMSIRLGPEEKSSIRDTSRKFRLMGVTAEVAKADLEYGNALKLMAQDFFVSAKNSVDSEADTTRKINPFNGRLKVKRLIVKDAVSTSLNLRETDNSFSIFPKRGQPQVPMLTLTSRNGRIALSSGRNRAILEDASIRASAAMNTVERKQKARAFRDSLAKAYPDVPRDSLFAHLHAQRTPQEVPEWLREEDFRKQDLDLRLDETMAKYFRDWDLKGKMGVKGGLVMTPHFPLRNTLEGFDLNFTNNEVKIDSFKVVSGKSELEAKGSLTGLKRALLGRGRSALKFNLDVSSDRMDANELLTAYRKGTMYVPEEGNAGEISDEELMAELSAADSLDASDSIPTLIVVPGNIVADVRLKASNVRYTDLVADSVTARIAMKERCLQITDTKALTNMGRMSFDAFYATRSKKDIKVGFDLDFEDITADKVIGLMPAIDTIMPLLKSFSGMLECEVAATASLDTNMNIIMPSINGIMRMSGEDLTISNNDMFRSLARKLLFRNKKEGRIEKMVVEGVIRDNTLEVFPFIIKMDRYMLALSGIQNLDMSYKYHASLIKSPFLIKLGVDVYGDDFDNMKFRIGKAKYRNGNVPVFSAVVDQTRINLAKSIHNIFEKGVDAAVNENIRQAAIIEHKQNIGYVRAVDMKLEELSASEQKQMEADQAAMEAEEAQEEAAEGNTETFQEGNMETGQESAGEETETINQES